MPPLNKLKNDFLFSRRRSFGKFWLKAERFYGRGASTGGTVFVFFRVSEIRCGTQTLFVLSCTAKNALGR